MADRDAVRQLLERYLGAFSTGSADLIAECVTEDFVNEHTSALGKNVQGRDSYRERLGGFLSSFIDLSYEAETMLIDGNEAAVPYTFSGRWRGPAGEYGDGRPFSIRGNFYFRIEDDGIARRVDYWDSAEFMRQVNSGHVG